jgi:hypothetical protein
MIRIRRHYTFPPFRWRVSCRLCGSWADYAYRHIDAVTSASGHIHRHQVEALDREIRSMR